MPRLVYVGRKRLIKVRESSLIVRKVRRRSYKAVYRRFAIISRTYSISREKGMKKFAAVIALTVLSVIIGSFVGCASMENKEYVPSDDKYFEYEEVKETTEEGETVVGYTVALKADQTELPETLCLPVSHNKLPVVAVKESGFEGSAVTKLSIPSNIKTIGAKAFKDCKSLTKVYFYRSTDDCKEIGNFAFSGCTALTDLDLSKKLVKIGSFAFNACGIKSIDIPRDVTTIGASAFSFCADLEHVTIAVKLSEVGENAFAQCSENLVIEVAASNPNFYSENGKLIKRA